MMRKQDNPPNRNRRGIGAAGLLAAAAIMLLLFGASCKSGSAPAEPTRESLCEAVRAYFAESGFEEVEPGRFQKSREDGSTEIHALDELPVHVCEIDSEDYPCQGIMVRRKTVRTADGKESEPQKLYVIMWWSREEGRWLHLTGSDIPEVHYEVK